MNKLSNSLVNPLNERLEPNLTTIGCFGIFTNLILLMMDLINPELLNFPTPVCFIGIAFGFILLIHKLLKNINEYFLYTILICSLMFLMPYEYILLLLLNQKIVFLHMVLIAVLGLYATIITIHWISPTIICGSLMAFGTMTLINLPHTLDTQLLITAYSSLIVLFTLSVFDHKRRNLEEEHRQYMKMIAGGIAHELKTPVVSISLTMKGISKFLPKLIASYKASDPSSASNSISDKHLHTLIHSTASVKQSTSEALMVIEMFLLKIKGVKTLTKNQHSIKNLINQALNAFPMTEGQRELITFNESNDFNIYANDLAIKHIINNLLKNALFQITKSHRGSITISLKKEPHCNLVFFKDTATGIKPEDLEHIFEKFFTKTEGGTGLGLSFCQETMQDFGGSITCTSELHQYTEFVLKFPVVSK